MKRALAAVAIAAVVSACSSGNRPSSDELADALESGTSGFPKMSRSMADCVADLLVASKISDRALQLIVSEKDPEYASTGSPTFLKLLPIEKCAE